MQQAKLQLQRGKQQMRMLDTSGRRAIGTAGTIITAACAAFVAAAVVAAPSEGSATRAPHLDRAALVAATRGSVTGAAGRSATTTTTTTPPATTTTTPSSNGLCQGTVPLGLTGGWHCTFDDEFNGTSLNTGLWVPQLTARSGYVAGPDCYVNDPSTISESGGYLNLSVRRVAPFSCVPGYTTDYVAGMVSTYGLFDQTYGAFEVSAKLPPSTVSGLQETFWLYPQTLTYGKWPDSGEIDFAEFYSEYPGFDIPYIHYAAVLEGSRRHGAHLHHQPEHVQHLRGRLDADLHHHPLQRHDLPRRPPHDGQPAVRPAVLHRADPGARHRHQRRQPQHAGLGGHDPGRLGAGLESCLRKNTGDRPAGPPPDPSGAGGGSISDHRISRGPAAADRRPGLTCNGRHPLSKQLSRSRILSILLRNEGS